MCASVSLFVLVSHDATSTSILSNVVTVEDSERSDFRETGERAHDNRA